MKFSPLYIVFPLLAAVLLHLGTKDNPTVQRYLNEFERLIVAE